MASSALLLCACVLASSASALLLTPLRMSTGMSMSMERTYIMIKPDGVQRGVVGNIISR